MVMRLASTQTIAIAITILAVAGACRWSGWPDAFPGAQSDSPRAPLHGVLISQKLTPSLTASLSQVRFSPNGAFILLQDEAGIRVLTREQLSLRLVVASPEALPAHFSADSQYVNVMTPALNSARYDLTFGSKVSETPPFDPEGCLAAAVSPDGELAACYNPAFRLTVFRIASKETIFSEVVSEAPPRHTPIPVPRSIGTAFAEPFGYFYSASMKGWVGRREYGSTMAFSTDARFLLARNSNGEVVAVDLSSRKTIPVPDRLRRRLDKAWCFAGPDRIIVLDLKKETDSAQISFPEGKVLARFPATGSGVAMLSQPRYVRIDSPSIDPPGGDASRVFDIESTRFVDSLPKGAADIFQDVAAISSNNDEVNLYKLGEIQPRDHLTLPVNPLPPLRTAIVSPNLDYFAIAVRGAGGIYRVPSGEQIASVPRMNGARIANEESLYFRSRQSDGSPAPVQKLDLKSGKAAQAWSEENPLAKDRTGDDLRPDGPVLLVVSPARSKPITGSVGIELQSTQAYQLRALNIENGKKLWSHDFAREVPVPFADPQGDRVVLAWSATSESGRNEAGRVPNHARHPKPSNLSEQDTFFEVLEARTGKIIGGALAQLGAGKEEFTGAYSAGDSLILIKDSIRITIFSLSTGQEVARLRGAFSSASGQTNLLTASDAKRLNLYDLKTGIKLDNFLFPEDIAYTHFSADGKRALVLTSNQTVYVLDVSGAAMPAATPAKP